jgi:signal peptidase I
MLQWIGLVCLTIAAAHASEADAVWIRGVYTGGSPRPVRVTEPEAWQRAAEIADNTPGAFVLVGTGQSMQPLYSPGTVLVLQQLPFGELKRGQTALYRSKGQKIVAHVLVAKARDGWRVQGLNNRIHDMEPVQSENFVGIVVAAFKPVSRTRSVSLAALPSTALRSAN